MATAKGRDTVSNQVFVGRPWKNVKHKYESITDRLRIKYPLFFKIIGREEKQDAKDLLEAIKTGIQNSSYAIFDATDGNANVSLEFGFAEAVDVPKVLYLSTYKSVQQRKDQPIISDLAGKTRHHYATEKSLAKLLRSFSETHPYTKLFEKSFRSEFGGCSKGEKKRARALALKVIHSLDDKEEVRRDDVVQVLLADQSDYKETEIDKMIRTLHAKGLIVSQRGRYSRLWVK